MVLESSFPFHVFFACVCYAICQCVFVPISQWSNIFPAWIWFSETSVALPPLLAFLRWVDMFSLVHLVHVNEHTFLFFSRFLSVDFFFKAMLVAFIAYLPHIVCPISARGCPIKICTKFEMENNSFLGLCQKSTHTTLGRSPTSSNAKDYFTGYARFHGEFDNLLD